MTRLLKLSILTNGNGRDRCTRGVRFKWEAGNGEKVWLDEFIGHLGIVSANMSGKQCGVCIVVVVMCLWVSVMYGRRMMLARGGEAEGSLGGRGLRRAGVSHWESIFRMEDAEIARWNILIARDSTVWPLAQLFRQSMQ